MDKKIKAIDFVINSVTDLRRKIDLSVPEVKEADKAFMKIQNDLTIKKLKMMKK